MSDVKWAEYTVTPRNTVTGFGRTPWVRVRLTRSTETGYWTVTTRNLDGKTSTRDFMDGDQALDVYGAEAGRLGTELEQLGLARLTVEPVHWRTDPDQVTVARISHGRRGQLVAAGVAALATRMLDEPDMTDRSDS